MVYRVKVKHQGSLLGVEVVEASDGINACQQAEQVYSGKPQRCLLSKKDGEFDVVFWSGLTSLARKVQE